MFFQPATAMRLVLVTTFVTSSRASAHVSRMLVAEPATSAGRVSGVSHSAVPVSVTATPTPVTHSLVFVSAAETTQREISARGRRS